MDSALEFARTWRRPVGGWLALSLIAYEVMTSRILGGSPDVALISALIAMWGWDNAVRGAENIAQSRQNGAAGA